ncbi:MAG: toxin-antitoxin system YwqK family antitoxin [Bacteroidia bacterium]
MMDLSKELNKTNANLFYLSMMEYRNVRSHLRPIKQLLALLIPVLLFSCGKSEAQKIITTFDTNKPEIVRYFADETDTTTYREERLYESGKPEYIGHLVNGKQDGIWTWWYENGNKKDQCKYDEGYYYDTVYHWYESGGLERIEIMLEKTVPVDSCCGCNATVIRYYENGKQKEIFTSVNNNFEGLCWIFDENGGWKIRTYRNDTLNGPTSEYLIDSGKVKYVAGQYEKGLETGLWKWFDQDSVLYQTAVYEKGVFSGEYLKFYPDGQIKEKSILLNGVYEGEVVYFDEDGSILKTEFYKNGELTRTKKE